MLASGLVVEAQLLFPGPDVIDDLNSRTIALLNSTQLMRIVAFGGLVAIAIGGLLFFLLIARAGFAKFGSGASYSYDRDYESGGSQDSYYEWSKRY